MDSLLKKRLLKILARKKADQGFSLVELVIVIAVLAILSAVAIPAFQGVQVRAKTAAVKNGLVNGIKECVVSSGLGESTQYQVAQAFQGNFQGYIVRPFNNNSPTASTTTCYQAEAVAIPSEANILPWFTIEYTPTTGVVTKSCALGGNSGPGCDITATPRW